MCVRTSTYKHEIFLIAAVTKHEIQHIHLEVACMLTQS